MKKIIKFYNIVFLLFPILTALGFAVICLVNSWEGLYDDTNMAYFFVPEIKNVLMGCVIFLFIMTLVWLLNKTIDTISKKIKQKYLRLSFVIFSIFTITFFSRFILIYTFREDLVPYSDIEEVWKMAQGIYGWNLDYYSLFPAYMNFSVFMRKLIDIFGVNYCVVLYINAIMEAITAVFVGLIGRIITKNDRTIIDAGLLYTFLVSNIFYVMMGTPEFLTICFNTIGLFLLLFFISRNNKRRYIALIGAGVCFGIGASFKSFAIIILIAFIMVTFVQVIENKSERTLKKVLIALVCVVCISGVYKLTKEVILNYTEKTMGMELSENSAMPHYFLIGLNTEGEGQIHIGTLSRLYYDKYLNNGHNVEEAKEYAWERLKEDWTVNYDKLPDLFYKKLQWAWQSDTIAIWYFDNNYGIQVDSLFEDLVVQTTNEVMPGICQMYYILLLFLIFIGGIFTNREDKINFLVEFLSLIIFGYACLMLLMESQSRYKCMIFPYICILAAIGGRRLLESILCKRKNKRLGEGRADD